MHGGWGGGMLKGGREVLFVCQIRSDKPETHFKKPYFLIYLPGCNTTHFSLLLQEGGGLLTETLCCDPGV